MAILGKSRALKHKPEYLMADAHALYDQASEKYLAAADAFIDEAATCKENIEYLTNLLAEEYRLRDKALQGSETALDLAEHMTKV